MNRNFMVASDVEGDRRFGSVFGFSRFLREAGITEGIDRRSLWTLYGEYCLDTNTEPLTEMQLLRRAQEVGIQRYRLPTGRREWRYRVRAIHSGFGLNLSQSVRHVLIATYTC
jgi:hypothetical protein